jgi:ribonuclease Z
MITDGAVMLDITLLGCGGTMPLPNRWLTSLLVRYKGRNILIDAGEGTQIALKQAGLSAHDIDLILITHFHGDHVMGLPGILMSMGTSGRTEPVTIVGPKGLLEIVPKLCVVAGIPFEVMGHELSGRKEEFDVPGFTELHVHAFRVSHSVETWGYSLVLDRAGRFNADAAKALNIPLKYWNRLQKGEEIDIKDFTASYQHAIAEALLKNTMTACKQTGIKKLCLAGGVSANSFLRAEFDKQAKAKGIKLYYPEFKYCTDNAAMIASCGYYEFMSGKRDSLDLNGYPSLQM